MILFDATYINNSGGRILLDLLIEKFVNYKHQVHFLLDKRVEGFYENYNLPHKTYITGLHRERLKFYKQKKSSIGKVFCFGNVPPPIKLEGEVFVYFHQSLFLQNFIFYFKTANFLLFLKIVYIMLLLKNCDHWFVQTDQVKKSLNIKFNVPFNSISVAPFYPSLVNEQILVEKIERNIFNFVYVSGGNSYKNHEYLLAAFELFSRRYNNSILHLTVSSEFSSLCSKIESLQKKKVQIINHGFVGRKEIAVIYSKCKYAIYPSLYESFGLGILEAIEMGCDIIGADLPYMSAVCEPSAKFNPKNISSLLEVMELAIKSKLPKSRLKVDNDIEKIIQLVLS